MVIALVTIPIEAYSFTVAVKKFGNRLHKNKNPLIPLHE